MITNGFRSKRRVDASYFNSATSEKTSSVSESPSPTHKGKYYASGIVDNSPEYKHDKIVVPKLPIVVKYSRNYDIVYIDNVIKEKLRLETGNAIGLEKEIERLEQQVEDSMSVPFINATTLKIKRLTIKVEKLKKDAVTQKYISETKDYIRKYKSIPKEEIVVDIMDLNQVRVTPTELQIERIVDEYLSKAVNYIELVIEKEVLEANLHYCISCEYDLSSIPSTRTGIRICPSCEAENKIPRAAYMALKEYDVFGNFLKAHRRYTCSIELKFDIKILMKELDVYFASTGEKPGKYYRDLPSKKNGRKEGTCQMRLCDALKAIGKVSYYKYYSSIGMHYWGWKPALLDHLLETIKKNFQIKQDEFDKMDPDERGSHSAPPTEFRLWAEYNHAGYKCDISLFKISRKPATLNRYIKTYSLMCERAGIKFPHV